MYLSKLSVRGLRASADGELDVQLPGRFAVIAGANSAGKTTFGDATFLAHPETFPSLPRFSAAALGSGDRSIDVEYRLESPGHVEGPLGEATKAVSGTLSAGEVVTAWNTPLSRRMGGIRAHRANLPDLASQIRVLYLPASRNPLDELARREARILVELLRAQQQRLDGTRNLTGLRMKAWGLLEALSRDPLIEAVEERITTHLASLTAGVSRQWPYVRGQRVDDAYLARVLELMLAVLEGRPNARPLEVTGLGYVNLLHIAVTLAAIPDPSLNSTFVSPFGGGVDGDGSSAANQHRAQAETEEIGEVERARAELVQSREEAELQEDSLFTDAPFHALVLIEEPEAHLHPQLQHSLTRHLRRITLNRPELQVILSTHATDILTSAVPEDLVVVRRRNDGRRVGLAVAHIPFPEASVVLRKARLHLDATRSSSLFAERLLLVEGVTDVIVVREFAWVWAGTDSEKQAFVDALNIVAMGTKVGSWPVRLLATPGYELVTRLAVLTDSDMDFADTPAQPTWASEPDQEVARVFHCHPTLEPQITAHNEPYVKAALESIGIGVPDPLTPESIHDIFKGRKTGVGSEPATPAGPGASRKAEFALAVGEQLLQAREAAQLIAVPAPIDELLTFLYPSLPDAAASDAVASDGPTDSPPVAMQASELAEPPF